MPNIVLIHPLHGAKVAISEQEVEDDIMKGWVRYPIIGIEAVQQGEPVIMVKRKGRPRKEGPPAFLTHARED